jgi:ribonuclease HII
VTDLVMGSVGRRRTARRKHRLPRDAHMRHERELRLAGFERIAGIDEVGRGSLAGPVVAAAVILPERHRIKGLRDSKVVPRARREALYAQILDRAQSVGVGCVEVDVIDRINILQATKLAMTEALRRMPQQPDHLVIDALSLREVNLPQRPIIDGDAISASIAAASIVAKVTRDRICTELDARYPAYGFARNKGYGTRHHVEALLNDGPCEWHRRSFAPLRLLLAGEQLSLDLLFDEEMPTEDELDPDDELAAEVLVAGEPLLEAGPDEEELAAAG